MTREELEPIINDHKGQLMALQSLATALLRAMPLSMRSDALEEWDKETELGKTVLLNSSAPESLVAAYDRYVKILNDLRIVPPPT